MLAELGAERQGSTETRLEIGQAMVTNDHNMEGFAGAGGGRLGESWATLQPISAPLVLPAHDLVRYH